MEKNLIEELNELYENLLDLGVIFYYGSELIEFGEITKLNFCNDSEVEIEISNSNNIRIMMDEFIENHSKEGVNYHTWNIARKFYNILNEEV